MPFICPQHRAPCDLGQSSVEFLVAAFAIIAGLSLILATSYWFMMKQTLLLHAQRAVEIGAMRGGQTVYIYQYLRDHLPAQRWRLGAVCVLDDVAALMRDFQDTELSQQRHQPLIRYNYLVTQHQRAVESGSRNGHGRYSGLTVSEANVLQVRVTAYLPVSILWMRNLLGPELKLTIRAQAVMQSHREKLTQQCMGKRAKTADSLP